MRSAIKGFSALLAGIAVVMMIFAGAAMAAEQRPTITDGERAMATIRVQNLMSKREYYHSANSNLQEVIDLWVAEDGPNAKTAAFFASAYAIAGHVSPGWVMQGIATIKRIYGHGQEANVQSAFTELQKVYPELAGMDPKTAAIGGEFAMHTNTTPVIEIAGDGQTAKGIWYSPGVGLVPHVKGKSVQVGSIFFWEKYAADFIKENGQWKIWHLGMSYDYTPALPESMTAHLGTGTQKAATGGPGETDGVPPQMDHKKAEKLTPEEIAAGGMLPQPYRREPWSPTRKNVIDPILPEPYHTFSETFSYAPYDSNNYHDPKFNPSYNDLYYKSLQK